MPGCILKKIIIILVAIAALIAAALFATSTGTLAAQIPGTDAAGKANTTCVYFFMHGFKNEATATSATCPRTIHLKDLDA